MSSWNGANRCVCVCVCVCVCKCVSVCESPLLMSSWNGANQYKHAPVCVCVCMCVCVCVHSCTSSPRCYCLSIPIKVCDGLIEALIEIVGWSAGAGTLHGGCLSCRIDSPRLPHGTVLSFVFLSLSPFLSLSRFRARFHSLPLSLPLSLLILSCIYVPATSLLAASAFRCETR
jgi:hypothetical protein